MSGPPAHPPRDGNLKFGTPLRKAAQGDFHHVPGARIDGGLPRRDLEAGEGHGAHPDSSLEGDPTILPPAKADPDLGTMGDIGIVPGILADRSLGTLRKRADPEHRQGVQASVREGNRFKGPGRQAQRKAGSRLGGRRSACAGTESHAHQAIQGLWALWTRTALM